MKEILLDPYIIRYEEYQTPQCSFRIGDQLFIEDVDLPRYFMATVQMSSYTFYHADCPMFSEADYLINDNFKKIIQKFPHTNKKKIEFDGVMYQFKDIPVVIDTHTYIQALIFPNKYKKCFAEIKKMENLSSLDSENYDQFIDKRKELLLDGQYGKRINRSETIAKKNSNVQDKLAYVNEMYSFARYSYAAMIEFLPEYKIETYDQFHEAYGHAIYSMTIEKNHQKIPLLWPDYLYHNPENHLEFGILAGNIGNRYQAFNDWIEGDRITVEILAEGFEDVQFESVLKKPLEVIPGLSKNDCLIGEIIEANLSMDIIDELKNNTAHFDIVLPNKEILHQETVSYRLTDNTLQIPSEQFGNQGRFQLKLYSEQYGQLLLLFTLRKDRKK